MMSLITVQDEAIALTILKNELLTNIRLIVGYALATSTWVIFPCYNGYGLREIHVRDGRDPKIHIEALAQNTRYVTPSMAATRGASMRTKISSMLSNANALREGLSHVVGVGFRSRIRCDKRQGLLVE